MIHKCRVVGLCSLCHWAWLLGEAELKEFDCIYPTLPQGWVLEHREELRHRSWGGKALSLLGPVSTIVKMTSEPD